MVRTYWKISEVSGGWSTTADTLESAMEEFDNAVETCKAEGRHYDISIIKCEVLKEEHS